MNITPRLRFLASCFAIGLALATPHSLVASGPQVRVATPISDVKVRSTREQTTIALPGVDAVRPDTPGLDDIPYKVINVAIPTGYRPTGVTASIIAERSLSLPSPVARVIVEHPQPAADRPMVATAFPRAPTDTAVARLLGAGFWHGTTIAAVAVHPLQRDGDRLRVLEDIELRVLIEPATSTPVTAGRMTSRRASDIENTIRQSVHAGEAVRMIRQDYSPTTHRGFAPRTAPSLEGSPVDMVIVTPETLADEFQRLADFKTAKGVPTVVRTVEWITANYRSGSDVQETIRTFVADAYSKWGTTLLLLGGDTDLIPARYCYSNYYYGGTLLPVDTYFGGIDGNWNTDGDAVWGEVSEDAVDLFPEVYVGRLTARDTSTANILIDKIITYETPVDLDYTDDYLYLGEVLFPVDWNPGDPDPIATNGADICEFNRQVNLSGVPLDIQRLYETPGPYPGALQESKAAAVLELEAGYNFVSHIGHGYRFNMRCGDVSILTTDADALTNGDRLFNLFMLNCTAAAYDFDCLGEHFLLNPNGGAVTVTGSNNSAFVSVASAFMNEYTSLLFQQGVQSAGEVFARSRLPRVPIALGGDGVDLWSQYIYSLLGDPEMPIWSRAVKAVAATHPTEVNLGVQNVAVNVTGNGTPVGGARVCLWKGEEDYQVGYTNGFGDVTIPFRAESPGDISVVVTGTNLSRYESTISANSALAPNLRIIDIAVNDDSTTTTSGNDDGIADAGELVEIAPYLQNSGGGSVGPAVLTLATSDGYSTVEDDTSLTLTNPSMSNFVAYNNWHVQFDSAAPDGHSAVFNVTLHDTGAGLTWTDNFAVVLRSPRLEVVSLATATGANTELTVEVRNYGTGAADSVTGTLRDLSNGFTLIDSVNTFGSVQPLQSATNAAVFTFVEDIPGSFLELTLSDNYGRTIVDTLELSPPTPPTDLLFDSGHGVDRIRVTWTASTSPDVTHYRVYRATNTGGPYALASNDPVAHSAFTDTGLQPNTRYYYTVAALDNSGNESSPSAEFAASTNPPQMPGWPLAITEPSANTPTVGDIDADGDLEVIVGNDRIYAWHHDGNEVRNGDADALTWGVFSDAGVNYIGPIALAPIDGVQGVDIVAASHATNQVYCFNYTGAVISGWPQSTLTRVRAAMTVGDVDGDDDLEIIAADQNGVLYVWHADGSELLDGDNSPATNGVFKVLPNTPWIHYQSPALADLDNDGEDEIIVTAQDSTCYAFNADGSDVPGWPVTLPDFGGGSVAIGDIDNNGQLDVVVPTKNLGLIAARRADGTALWQRFIPYTLFYNPSPALADLTGDGKLECVIPSNNGRVYIFTSNGSDLPGWPLQYSTSTYTESSPVIADINGDQSLDIILGDEGRFIGAWNIDGTPIDGFPLLAKDAVRGTPTIADLDKDGDIEIVVSGYDRTVYVWDLTSPFDPDYAPWPTFQGNALHTGRVGAPTITSTPPVLPARAQLAQNYPNPFNPITRIRYTVPGESLQPVDLRVYDVAGRLVATLVTQEQRAGAYTVAWDGRNRHGQAVSSGVYFYRLRLPGFSSTKKMVLVK